MKCQKCGHGNMIIRCGEYGLFAGCDSFPKCKNTMKLSKFLYEVMKKDGIYIYGWNIKCWKCHQDTRVYTYFINKQIKPYMEKGIELDNIGLDSIPSIDTYLKSNYKTINKNYSKTQNRYCTSNNCVHCNALIGNYFIVRDPHDIFNDWLGGDLNKYLIEKIPFARINIKERELNGFGSSVIQIVDDIFEN